MLDHIFISFGTVQITSNRGTSKTPHASMVIFKLEGYFSLVLFGYDGHFRLDMCRTNKISYAYTP